MGGERLEDPDAHIAEGRPRRRYYRLTREGAECADEALRTIQRTRKNAARVWRIPAPGTSGPALTKPAQAIAAANAVIADRYATAAAVAAREARRAASMAVQPSRVQNVTPEFIGRADKAARTGEKYEQILPAASVYGQMAGIASMAKYAAAAANAAR